MWLHSEIRTLGDIPRHYAQTMPESPALIDAAGADSWARLDSRSNQVARVMLDLGITPGDRVALLGKNFKQYFEVLFGVGKVSASLVPLNWRLAKPELVGIINDARPAVLLVDEEYADTAAAVIAASDTTCRVIGYDSANPDRGEWAGLVAAASDTDPGIEVNPWETVVLMYTSGTTGLPKGVQLSHQNYLYLRLCEHLEPSFNYTADDVMLTVMPLFHAMGVGLSLQALYNGAAVAVYSMPTPAELIELIERDRPTILPLVPAVIQMMLEVAGESTEVFAPVRVVVYAGAAMPMAVLQRALKAMDCDFIQFYGSTETAAGVTFLRPEQHRQGAKLETCGSPLPLVEIKIADPLGDEVPDGAVGEFLIRAPSLTTGYFNQPELTAAAFAGGWYHSGDAGFRDEEGFLHLVDRVKDMIITGGENVYSTEVENALGQVDGVQMCAAVGLPDDKWGERVVGVVVADPSAALTEATVIAQCRELIAGYKVPKEIRFLNELPMTASGKVMKNSLREQIRANGEGAS
ncbi:hypothetical protein ASG90_01400 [Nocardioides sp. Soil797]|nr:hypothetical protein ASG90_01400 [Nocardioides sp. Soil797]